MRAEERAVRKARPLIFSASMVRAILAGTKTQTRRLVKKQNSCVDGQPCNFWSELDFNDAFVDPGPSPAGNPGPYLKVARPTEESRHRVYPRVQPGDLIWCKETWGPCAGGLVFRADDAGSVVSCPDGGKWRSSMFMPRWASRITLEITEARVERLQDISEEDALAEGVDPYECPSGPATPDARSAYAELWDRLNKDRCPWSASPWVWIISFKRVDTEAAQ